MPVSLRDIQFLIHDLSTWRGQRVVATDEGGFRYGKGAWRPLQATGMPCGDRVVALARFDDALWVGSFDKGLCRLDDKGWQHFSGPEYLPSDMVHDMAASASHLYVATHKGLAVVDARGQFRMYTRDMCKEDRKRKCPWFNTVNGVTIDALTQGVNQLLLHPLDEVGQLDVSDLFERAKVGTRVVVMPGGPPPGTATAQAQPAPALATVGITGVHAPVSPVLDPAQRFADVLGVSLALAIFAAAFSASPLLPAVPCASPTLWTLTRTVNFAA